MTSQTSCIEATLQEPSHTELAPYQSKARGRKPRLTAEQKLQLPALLALGPRHYGYYDDVWTQQRVQQLIQHHFGVRCSLSVVQRTLNEIGYAYKPANGRAHLKNRTRAVRLETLIREVETVFGLR